MNATKRDILLALTALAATAAAPAFAQDTPTLDLSAGRPIGQAYLAANQGLNLSTLRAELLPNGFTAEAANALRQCAAADFAAGRIFDYRGWKLSETEGRLFALLA